MKMQRKPSSRPIRIEYSLKKPPWFWLGFVESTHLIGYCLVLSKLHGFCEPMNLIGQLASLSTTLSIPRPLVVATKRLIICITSLM
jgi:hypothetical protein